MPRATRKQAEDRFRRDIAALGGEVLGEYLGLGKPVLIRCVNGHESTPRPGNVANGQGVCKACRSLEARNLFEMRLSDLGMTLVGEWKGSTTRNTVRCSNGHVNDIFPASVHQSRAITGCRNCSKQSPEDAWDAFKERVTEMGGKVTETEWLGVGEPHRVTCPKGHATTTRPKGVRDGSGMCRVCRGKTWDVVYLVQNQSTGSIKFGVTSGDPRPRLATHARNGYRAILLLAEQLPDGVAHTTERAVLGKLKDNGFEPERGVEYFGASALPTTLTALKEALEEEVDNERQ